MQQIETAASILPISMVNKDAFRLPVAAVFDALQSSADGLTPTEAIARLAQYGQNQVEETARADALVQVLRRFANPLILILLIAAGISAATGQVSSFIIIVLMVLLSVTLDFVQERRAGRAAD